MNRELEEKLNKIVNEHGIRIDAFIPLLTKMDKLIELQDRNNFLMSFMEKKLSKIIELLESKK